MNPLSIEKMIPRGNEEEKETVRSGKRMFEH